jgi:hypothetical protein
LDTSSAVARFDPVKVGRYETANWVAYYQRRWLRLLRVSVMLVREAFQLPLPQAIYGAYLVGRAEFAAAPVNNDIPQAERYMQRFYAMIKRVHNGRYDVQNAARVEVNWWVVHRQLFANADNEPLIAALQALYAEVFQIDASRVRRAAELRAEAMLHSDRWVREGALDASPRIPQIEASLIASYAALKEALQHSPVGISFITPSAAEL